MTVSFILDNEIVIGGKQIRLSLSAEVFYDDSDEEK